MNALHNQLTQVKEASYTICDIDDAKKNAVLLHLSQALRKSCSNILQENAKDLATMPKEDHRYDRLQLTEARINQIADDVEKVSKLPTPIGTILSETVRPNGLRIQKVSVPFGVIAVIYESRPNVTIDVFSLCFKAGNACVLKGGKEAHFSNSIFVKILKEVLQSFDINPNIVMLMPPSREATQQLLEAHGLIDVCIPRGSQALIDFVRTHAKIPVIETGAGIVHTYFDIAGDLSKGKRIIENAKTRRISVCNALDTLVIHRERLNDLQTLVQALIGKNVELFADEESHTKLHDFYPENLLHKATPEDFGREFLDYKMSIKTVGSTEEAVQHIMKHTSAHSEAIISEDKVAVAYFQNHVDAAVVYVNASTAFTDGGEFGMGAEIGISTQKLHARGPMGLEALTSYKWLVLGDGQIR